MVIKGCTIKVILILTVLFRCDAGKMIKQNMGKHNSETRQRVKSPIQQRGIETDDNIIWLEMFKLSREISNIKERVTQLEKENQILRKQNEDILGLNFTATEIRNSLELLQSEVAQQEKLNNQTFGTLFTCLGNCSKDICPQGYTIYKEGGFCYKFHSSCSSWGGARQTCQQEGADLIVFSSRNDFTTFRNLTKLIHTSKCNRYYGFWIGLSDVAKGWGDWRWVNGKRVGSEIEWGPGEPNNAAEQCALIWHYMDNKLNDGHCSTNGLSFICAHQ